MRVGAPVRVRWSGDAGQSWGTGGPGRATAPGCPPVRRAAREAVGCITRSAADPFKRAGNPLGAPAPFLLPRPTDVCRRRSRFGRFLG